MSGPQIYAPIPRHPYNELFIPPVSPQLPTVLFEKKNYNYMQALQDLIQRLQPHSNGFCQKPPIEHCFRMFVGYKAQISPDELLLTLFVFYYASFNPQISVLQPDLFTLALIYAQPLFLNNCYDTSLLFSERSWVRQVAQAQNSKEGLLLCHKVLSTSLPEAIASYDDLLHPQNLTNRESVQKWHALCYWLSLVCTKQQETTNYRNSFHTWLQQIPNNELVQMSSQVLYNTASLIDYFCLFFTPCNNLSEHLCVKLKKRFDNNSEIIQFFNTLSLQEWQKLPASQQTALGSSIHVLPPTIALDIVKKSICNTFENSVAEHNLTWVRKVHGPYKRALYTLLEKEQIASVFRAQFASELMQNSYLELAEKLEWVTTILKSMQLEPIDLANARSLLYALYKLYKDSKKQPCNHELVQTHARIMYETLIEKLWSYKDVTGNTHDLINEFFIPTTLTLRQSVVELECTCPLIEYELQLESKQDTVVVNLMNMCLFYARDLSKLYKQSPCDLLIAKKNEAIQQAFRLYSRISYNSSCKSTATSTIKELLHLANCSSLVNEIRFHDRFHDRFDTFVVENAPQWICDIVDQMNRCVWPSSDVQSYFMQ